MFCYATRETLTVFILSVGCHHVIRMLIILDCVGINLTRYRLVRIGTRVVDLRPGWKTQVLRFANMTSILQTLQQSDTLSSRT
ncbi:hypothetical protein BJY04DRAFT_183792 [Aspergillus karnatakaensis]|uniref:uncharacterized protein n=1 Tax=Aspergillus karnatakaensis TaxID=1810916 RepID=UPI003CCD8C70